MHISQRDLNQYAQGTANYVYLHYVRRKYRGKKNPSVPYGGITNPLSALALASSVVEKLEASDEMAQQGATLIAKGRTYATASDAELGLMIKYLVEESKNFDVACKSLEGLLSIPTKAECEVWTASFSDYLVEVQQSFAEVGHPLTQLERDMVRALNHSSSENMIREVYRCRGGLCTKDGALTGVQIIGKSGDLLQF